MFRFNDPILTKWDTFIIIIAIYNLFVLSYNIGFSPSWAKHPAFITFDSIQTLIYVLDIVVSFFTTYVDSEGFEVWNLWMI